MSSRTMPLVSVIIPIYNVERFVSECLDSVRFQSYKNLEIILVEDCSTDRSLAEIQPHLDDPRVTLIKHAVNSGLSAARNTGINIATGEYILFVDSDDIVARNLVEVCATHALDTGAELVVFDFIAFQEGGQMPEIGSAVGTSNSRRLQSREYLLAPHFAWLKFIRASILQRSTLRFPTGFHYEDWPFHWELGFLARSIFLLEGQWYLYRQRDASITSSVDRKMLDQIKVQHIVLQAIRAHGRHSDVHTLSAKAHMTFWTVLFRIDKKLLPEAVARAKRLRAELPGISFTAHLDTRGVLMSILLDLPAPAGLSAVKCIRFAKSCGVAAKGLLQRKKR